MAIKSQENSYLGIGYFGVKIRAGNMEDSSATINGSTKAIVVQQVCLEQFQILWSLLQFFQMTVLSITWSNGDFEWGKLNMKNPEMKWKLKEGEREADHMALWQFHEQ